MEPHDFLKLFRFKTYDEFIDEFIEDEWRNTDGSYYFTEEMDDYFGANLFELIESGFFVPSLDISFERMVSDTIVMRIGYLSNEYDFYSVSKAMIKMDTSKFTTNKLTKITIGKSIIKIGDLIKNNNTNNFEEVNSIYEINGVVFINDNYFDSSGGVFISKKIANGFK